MGSDSANSIDWAPIGKAKQGAAMRLLYFLGRYCVVYDIDFCSFTIRPERKISPDFSPRASRGNVRLATEIRYGSNSDSLVGGRTDQIGASDEQRG